MSKFSPEDTQSGVPLDELIQKGDPQELNGFLNGISPSETAWAVSHLDDESRKKLLILLRPGDAANVLHDLPDEQAAVAVCLGGVIPLALEKTGIDPALASGPLLTTVTDMCGFFFALSFATAALPLIS